ncbi:protein of unknown function [Methanoculleus bourgensis]|uniref:Uncharacterized protein n=1 Tax=Methanoculleus bourgensis TaxID=83986 RepID=A0A0X3BH01_9EURY|nr:protein of unknown function [Methanoculleus bourgensis]
MDHAEEREGMWSAHGQSAGLYAGKTLLPGQWTVVAITPGGVGAGEGARPLPAQTGPGAQTEP